MLRLKQTVPGSLWISVADLLLGLGNLYLRFAWSALIFLEAGGGTVPPGIESALLELGFKATFSNSLPQMWNLIKSWSLGKVAQRVLMSLSSSESRLVFMW